MSHQYIPPDVKLEHAYETIHRLKMEGGDLGYAYWDKVEDFLKNADSFRKRALAAEEKLRKISAVVAE